MNALQPYVFWALLIGGLIAIAASALSALQHRRFAATMWGAVSFLGFLLASIAGKGLT